MLTYDTGVRPEQLQGQWLWLSLEVDLNLNDLRTQLEDV